MLWWAIIGAFIAGGIFGALLLAVLVANRRDD